MSKIQHLMLFICYNYKKTTGDQYAADKQSETGKPAESCTGCDCTRTRTVAESADRV